MIRHQHVEPFPQRSPPPNSSSGSRQTPWCSPTNQTLSGLDGPNDTRTTTASANTAMQSATVMMTTATTTLHCQDGAMRQLDFHHTNDIHHHHQQRWRSALRPLEQRRQQYDTTMTMESNNDYWLSVVHLRIAVLASPANFLKADMSKCRARHMNERQPSQQRHKCAPSMYDSTGLLFTPQYRPLLYNSPFPETSFSRVTDGFHRYLGP